VENSPKWQIQVPANAALMLLHLEMGEKWWYGVYEKKIRMKTGVRL
jgi:hypothetical protein